MSSVHSIYLFYAAQNLSPLTTPLPQVLIDDEFRAYASLPEIAFSFVILKLSRKCKPTWKPMALVSTPVCKSYSRNHFFVTTKHDNFFLRAFYLCLFADTYFGFYSLYIFKLKSFSPLYGSLFIYFHHIY